MVREEQYLLKLIYSYLNNKEFEENTEGINWRTVYDAAHFNGVANLTYYALAHFKHKIDSEVANTLYLEHEDYIGVEALQEMEIQNLLEIFEEEGIDCMPLKGYILKNMYPLVDMREMCDIDMLIRENDYPAIKRIMEENGFSFDKETPHEYNYCKGDMLNIELHKYVVPDYNKILYGYYGDGWDMAKKQCGREHIYEFGIEDFYVYNFVHTAKHYLNSGIGIRQVLDLWIIAHKNPDMDFDYIEEQIEKLGLTKFKTGIDKLIKRWFDGEDIDDGVVDEMEEYILRNGVRGVVRQEKISRIYRSSEKNEKYDKSYRRVLLDALFPSVEMISLGYPIVRKSIVFYPFCWIHRLINNLLFQRTKLKNKFARDGIENSEVEAFSKHCDLVGLRNDL